MPSLRIIKGTSGLATMNDWDDQRAQARLDSSPQARPALEPGARWDPIGVVALSAFVLLSVGLAVHAYSTWSALWRSEARRVELISDFAARTVDAVFAQLAGNLQALGPLLVYADDQRQPDRIAQAIHRFRVSNPDLVHVALIDGEGSALYTSGALPDETWAPPAVPSPADAALAEGVVVGQTQRQRDGQWVIPLRHAVLDEGRRARMVIAAGLPAGERPLWLAAMRLPDELSLRLLRADGQVQLVYPARATRLDTIYTQPLPEAERARIAAVPAGPQPASQWTADGERRLGSALRLSAAPLVVEVSLPRSLVVERWWSAVAPVGLLQLAFALGLLAVYRLASRARERADRARLESEARFRDFAEASGDWYWETDAQGRFIAISDGVSRQTGIPATGYIGKARWQLPGNFEPEDSEFWRRHRADLDARRPFRRLRYGGTPNGRISWSEVSGKPHHDADGRFLGYRGVASDVTALVLSQQALRRATERMSRIFDHSPVPIAVISLPDRRPLEINQAFARLYGYSREQLAGASVDALGLWVDESERERFRAEFAAAGHISGFLAQARRSDGEIRDVELTAETIEEGGDRLMLAIVVDVTERRRAERALLELNAELERRVESRTRALTAANRELEAFVFSVSHDLRAPLRGIDGFAGLLEERIADRIDDEASSYLQRVRGGAQRMARIIEDLLALSRVIRAEPQHLPVDLSAMAHAIADELARSDPGRCVHWQIASGLAARGDPGLLRLVLENLLGNAWKYTRRRAEAVIGFEEVARGDGRVEFRVRDNGAGFDMTYAGQLFQPFRRLHGQTEYEGTGVGLATVRRVIERHGGAVRGEAEVDRGAVFVFSLPAVNDER